MTPTLQRQGHLSRFSVSAGPLKCFMTFIVFQEPAESVAGPTCLLQNGNNLEEMWRRQWPAHLCFPPRMVVQATGLWSVAPGRGNCCLGKCPSCREEGLWVWCNFTGWSKVGASLHLQQARILRCLAGTGPWLASWDLQHMVAFKYSSECGLSCPLHTCISACTCMNTHPWYSTCMCMFAYTT